VLCCDYFKQVQYSERGLKQGIPFWPTMSDDGSFVFPSIPSGNYALSVLDRNSIPVSRALAVGPNGVTGLQLDLIEGVEVQGTILDQIGKPVPADIRLVPRAAIKQTNSEINTGPPMYTGDRPRVFESGSLPGSRFVLRGILIPRAHPSLDSVQNLIVEVATMQEHSLLQDHSLTPEADGRFAFHNVFPGTYLIEVNAGGVALPGKEIQVGLTGVANLSFQVPVVQVAGRIISPGGGQLPKLNYIRLTRRGSDADVFYGFPDKAGNFSIVLAPGQYRVYTDGLGHSVQSISDGSRDITNTEVTIEVGRTPQIVVTLAQ